MRIQHRSKVLRDNPWSDPTERELCVYLPPGYDPAGEPRVALWDLAAFTNSGLGHLNWRHHGETLAQRLDRLIATGELPPVVVVMPDCFTSLGGNQYVDSPAVGAYASYVVDELIPLLQSEIHVGHGPAFHAAFGTSSGGYGAFALACHKPGTFGAVAMHAADAGFELLFRPEFPVAATQLQLVNGDIPEFLKRFWRKRKPGRADYTTLLVIAMAASYDPDSADPANIRLPFRLTDGALIAERWQRWLEHDPVNLVDAHANELSTLRGLYIDVGNRDEHHIQFGTRALVAKLENYGIRHHFEEFEGGHRGLDWRLDRSLPYLVNALNHGPVEAEQP
ncbi:MAG: alpha/beta hydrolase-fold protein [Xanthomonadales bacterium]|nr:alpha/beta hydrolase-fold protein [Xanthomonadales bacterium]